MLSNLRPLWEGAEEEVFGEAGFEEFMKELESCDFGLDGLSGVNNDNNAAVSDDDAMMVDDMLNEGVEPDIGRLNAITLRADGREIASFVPRTDSTQSQPQSQDSPVRLIRFPIRRHGSTTTPKKKKKRVQASKSPTNSHHSFDTSTSSQRSPSPRHCIPDPPSPTYPLKPVAKPRVGKLGQATPERTSVVNRAYVELPSSGSRSSKRGQSSD